MGSENKFPCWEDLPVGADIPVPGSSIATKTGLWRSERPEWDHKKCIKCGVCVIFCPEGCIEFKEDGYPHADLDYCKGCGICARECFTGCIKLVKEKE